MANKDPRKTIERDLFEWEGWDQAEFMSIMFHDITLKRDIGIYKKGTKFKWCLLDFTKSSILFGNEEPVGSYELRLSVLDAVPLEIKDGE